MKLAFVVFFLIIYSNLLIKISIALMLLRIKRDFWWRLLLWSLITGCIVVGISATITNIVQCRPTSGFWHLDQRLSGHCWSNTTFVNISYIWGCRFSITDLRFGFH